MATKQVKAGDGGSVGYQLKNAGVAYDVSNTNLVIYASGKTGTTTLFHERNINSQAKGSGSTTNEGKILFPIWLGRTLQGSTNSVTVTNAADHGQCTVTFAAHADSTNCVGQEIYLTNSTDNSVFYRVAYGNNGFAANGVTIGGTTWNAADAALYMLAPTIDESATEGHDALGTPATPAVTVAGAGNAGTLAAATHFVAVVDVAQADSYLARTVSVEIIVVDRTTNVATTWPTVDFETIEYTADVPA